MRYAYIAMTRSAKDLAEKIAGRFGGDIFPTSAVKDAYAASDVLVFLVPAQTAIRLLSPLVVSSITDPVVLLMDPEGKYVISLLSGPAGDANERAEEIALFLGAQVVSTTSSDSTDILSLSAIAEKNGLFIENQRAMKTLQSLLLQGAVIELHTDHDIEWETMDVKTGALRVLFYDAEDARMIRRSYQMCKNEDVPAVFLTSRTLAEEDEPYPEGILVLRPRDIILGVSCRSRSNDEYVLQAVRDTLRRQTIPDFSIRAFATGSLTSSEPAIVSLAASFGVPLLEVMSEQLRGVDYLFMQTPFVQTSRKVENAAAAAAYLASERGRMLLTRASHPGGVTVAVAQERRKIRI